MKFSRLYGVLLTIGAVSAQASGELYVVGMKIADTIDSNTSATTLTAGPDGLGTDGRSGAFQFANIDLDTYKGASIWTGNLNGGFIPMAGSGPLTFTTGFTFAGGNFQPFNGVPTNYIQGSQSWVGSPITASVSATADAAASGTVLSASDLTINLSGWSGYYASADYIFRLTPDPGTLTIVNFIKTGEGVTADIGSGSQTYDTYAYRLTFSHDITTEEDPSGYYTGFTARWVLEGTMYASAVPEADSILLSAAGLGALGLLSRRRRRQA